MLNFNNENQIMESLKRIRGLMENLKAQSDDENISNLRALLVQEGLILRNRYGSCRTISVVEGSTQKFMTIVQVNYSWYNFMGNVYDITPVVGIGLHESQESSIIQAYAEAERCYFNLQFDLPNHTGSTNCPLGLIVC